MIRLIATDMDGTLLNSGHEISQENIEAIRYAQSQGVTVVIATGRAFYEANMPVKPTGLTVPYICLNGAEIRDEQFNITHTSHLNPEQIEEVTGVLRKYDIFYQVYTNFGIYTEDKEKTCRFISTLPCRPVTSLMKKRYAKESKSVLNKGL